MSVEVLQPTWFPGETSSNRSSSSSSKTKLVIQQIDLSRDRKTDRATNKPVTWPIDSSCDKKSGRATKRLIAWHKYPGSCWSQCISVCVWYRWYEPAFCGSSVVIHWQLQSSISAVGRHCSPLHWSVSFSALLFFLYTMLFGSFLEHERT